MEKWENQLVRLIQRDALYYQLFYILRWVHAVQFFALYVHVWDPRAGLINLLALGRRVPWYVSTSMSKSSSL